MGLDQSPRENISDSFQNFDLDLEEGENIWKTRKFIKDPTFKHILETSRNI
jgi:hypothetical protein